MKTQTRIYEVLTKVEALEDMEILWGFIRVNGGGKEDAMEHIGHKLHFRAPLFNCPACQYVDDRLINIDDKLVGKLFGQMWDDDHLRAMQCRLCPLNGFAWEDNEEWLSYFDDKKIYQESVRCISSHASLFHSFQIAENNNDKHTIMLAAEQMHEAILNALHYEYLREMNQC